MATEPRRAAANAPAPPTADTARPRWTVELSDEVVAWYVRLGARDRAFADRAFDRLERSGPSVAMPHARPLGAGLYELRFSCEGVSRRVTFVRGPGRGLSALTTFRKERSVERHEIDRARRAVTRGVERGTPERRRERGR